MGAREDFLSEIRSLQEASDLGVLVDSTIDARVRRKLMVGVAVSSFVALEEFLESRLEEISDYISRGSSDFLDMPEVARKTLLERAARNFNSELQAARNNESQRVAAAKSLSRTLSSVDGAALELGKMTFGWAGANLQRQDLEDILGVLGCSKKPWENLAYVLKRGLKSEETVRVDALVDGLASARHAAAHSSATGVTVTQLRTLPRSALRIGFSLDCMAARLAVEIHSGSTRNIPEDAHKLVAYRHVQPTGARWRLIGEGQQRGRLYDTQDAAWRKGIGVSESNKEVLVELSSDGDPVDWRPAGCP